MSYLLPNYFKNGTNITDLIENIRGFETGNTTFEFRESETDLENHYLEIIDVYSSMQQYATVNHVTGNLNLLKNGVDLSTLLCAKGYAPGNTNQASYTSGSGSVAPFTPSYGGSTHTVKRAIVFMQAGGGGGSPNSVNVQYPPSYGTGGGGGGGGGSQLAVFDWPQATLYWRVGAGGSPGNTGGHSWIGDDPSAPTHFIRSLGGPGNTGTGSCAGGTGYSNSLTSGWFDNIQVLLWKNGGTGGAGGYYPASGATGGSTNTASTESIAPLTGQTLYIYGRVGASGGSATSYHYSTYPSPEYWYYTGGGGGGGASGSYYNGGSYGYGGRGESGIAGGGTGYAATSGYGGIVRLYY